MTLQELTDKLHEATAGKLLDYQEVKRIDTCGLYIIYKDAEIIYVGKTDRNGKIRLQELAADYRSHTLNRKLLQILLNEHFKYELPPLNKETKHRLISGGTIDEKAFLDLQARVNYEIRNHLRFRFFQAAGKELLRLEHFAIAVLNPTMND